jgi:glutamate/tyrosine decarboxylase-like PLP-dependent enzyme
LEKLFVLIQSNSERRVTPEVEPGYLRPLLPENPPEQGEPWEDIMKDVEQTIMPGITHWQHPRFHAYFPAGNSYPSILAEMLSAGLGIVGFSWAASPACTELEPIMLDWLGRMMSLPAEFLPFNRNTIEPISCNTTCQSISAGGGALLVNDHVKNMIHFYFLDLSRVQQVNVY